METKKLYVDNAYDLTEGKTVKGGYVELIDTMGDDLTPARTARLSYTNADKKRVRDDGKLLKYLWINQHTSPFEFVEVVFKIRMPVFVARQFDRHRTASQNQMSFRYSNAIDLVWIPDCFREQGKLNKQGSAGCTDSNEKALEIYFDSVKAAFDNYRTLLDLGVAKEQARSVLPFSIYTEVAWKQDFKNLTHLLKLRIDHHAQLETRKYAAAMLMLLEERYPLLTDLFKNYTASSVTLTLDELSKMLARASGEYFPELTDSRSRNKELNDVYMLAYESYDPESGYLLEYEKIKESLLDFNKKEEQ